MTYTIALQDIAELHPPSKIGGGGGGDIAEFQLNSIFGASGETVMAAAEVSNHVTMLTNQS